MAKIHVLRRVLWISLLVAMALSILPSGVTKADSAPIRHYQPLLKLGRGEITSIDWQASGKTILVNTAAGVWLYDDQLRDVAHLEDLTAASFNPKGNLIAGKRANKIVLLDANSLLPVETFPDSADTVFDLKWSPDSSKIAGLWKSGKVVIWDATTYQELFVFWQSAETNTFAWSPDSTKFVALDQGGNTASVWRISTYPRRFILPLKLKSKYSTGGGSLVWSADGKQILRTVRLSESGLFQSWDSQNATILYELENNGVYSFTYSPDGQRLALASDEMQIVDSKTFKSLLTYQQSASVSFVRWSPDGRIIAGAGIEVTSTFNYYIARWDTSTGQLLNKVSIRDRVNFLRWSPDSHLLLTIDERNIIALWDSASDTVINERSDHGLITPTIAFNSEVVKLPLLTRGIQYGFGMLRHES